ncbi:UDP-2,3-diacylglucosamine diphosphatase [Glaciecola sp. KUL10]|uniref:UDP-2,3-diacylglucosamine diphosphatase n=1 Tax=Glaciecola sp. (strain KUL10) TaxID=2161813 RepID=UPI000D78B4B3|nr:UDP-2,3-diacylglucosamine diphosphatase [Glaciecola sp. KUL10]GBL04717.1 metallophosphoesterase [Glaciecola sp. KUL10]
MPSPKQYKTIWLSDIHLGNKDCKAELLLDFLKLHRPEKLYLVGDIIDMWQMHRQFRWPKAHNEVMHAIFKLSNEGTDVIYLPGNHDEPLQKYSGMDFSGISVLRETIHTAEDGKRYLVLHGDQFDEEVCLGKFEAWIGDKLYDLLLFINRWYNKLQQSRRKHYFSLAGFIKSHINGAQKAIARYRVACTKRAKEMGLDGVICGHIHHPEITNENGTTYINDGDWIENCSAVAENSDGSLEIIYWQKPALSAVESNAVNEMGDSQAEAA